MAAPKDNGVPSGEGKTSEAKKEAQAEGLAEKEMVPEVTSGTPSGDQQMQKAQ